MVRAARKRLAVHTLLWYVSNARGHASHHDQMLAAMTGCSSPITAPSSAVIGSVTGGVLPIDAAHCSMHCDFCSFSAPQWTPCGLLLMERLATAVPPQARLKMPN